MRTLSLHLCLRLATLGHKVSPEFFEHELIAEFSAQPIRSGYDGFECAPNWQKLLEFEIGQTWNDFWMYAPPIPCDSAAWAGTSFWVPVFYQHGQELLMQHNGRVYGVFSSTTPLERNMRSVETALNEFYESTETIRSATISMKHSEEKLWVDKWDKVLSGKFDENFVEYAQAYLPGVTDTDANRHAITCVMNSWCFGGMGWWNDGVSAEALEEIGTPYFAAQRNLIAAVGNVPIEAA